MSVTDHETAQADTFQSLIEAQGLLYLGTVALGPEPRFTEFSSWLAAGKNADMKFLERHGALRQDPRGLLPGAQVAVVMALAYGRQKQLRPRIAQYAQLRDYHKVLRRLGAKIVDQAKEAGLITAAAQSRVVVDSAPVLERALAARTSQGFIGKNTLYIHPRFGSKLLLSEILLDQRLATDKPAAVDPQRRSAQGGCGSCRRCSSHCPTGALSQDYVLDARLCLAYWSIEHRGEVPRQFWPYFAEYLFGCDICQQVCPYNRGDLSFAPSQNSGSAGLTPSQLRQRLTGTESGPVTAHSLTDIANMTHEQYCSWFGGTPMTRAGHGGLRRNALLALWATERQVAVKLAQTLVDDPEPVVAATAKAVLEDLRTELDQAHP